MKVGKHPTQEELHELLNYDPKTGIFVWKARQLHSFKESKWRARNCKIWNTSNAGKQAGCFDGRYIVIGINGRSYQAHRLAWIYVYGELGDDEVDHTNWDGTDNRIEKLKRTDRVGNQLNMYKKANNTTGVVGVSYDKSRLKWLAHICSGGMLKNLGRFSDFTGAVKARYNAEVAYGFTEFLPESTAFKYLTAIQT